MFLFLECPRGRVDVMSQWIVERLWDIALALLLVVALLLFGMFRYPEFFPEHLRYFGDKTTSVGLVQPPATGIGMQG